MNGELIIVRSENKERLCYVLDEMFIDVSNPIRVLVAGEDEFDIFEPDDFFRWKEYGFRGELYHLVPAFYPNGWPALFLVNAEDERDYIILTANLEKNETFGIPDRAFVDVNNYPDAMEFLVENGLAADWGYRRKSGFVDYPMVKLNLPLLFRHNPQVFYQARLDIFRHMQYPELADKRYRERVERFVHVYMTFAASPLEKAVREVVRCYFEQEEKHWLEAVATEYPKLSDDTEPRYDPALCPGHVYHSLRVLKEWTE